MGAVADKIDTTDLSALSDEQISNLTDADFEEQNALQTDAEEVEETGEVSDDTTDETEDDTSTDSDESEASAEDTAEEEEEEDAPGPTEDEIENQKELELLGMGNRPNEDPFNSDVRQRTQKQQSKKPEAKPAPVKKDTADVDYKDEYQKLMSPFKAAKRTITPTNIDDARRLMQMGVDYSRKMEAMKPHQRIIKTLEKNDLLDVGKINTLIDLSQKNPEAIAKFLADNDIDPMSLPDTEDIDYSPTDYMVDDKEIELDNVLSDIKGTESFDRTIEEITNKWDEASRLVLLENPNIITSINNHIAAGVYDQIMDNVDRERTFGRLSGISDLEAYKLVGDAMQQQGAFNDISANQAAGNNNQEANQGLDQDALAAKRELKNRKKSASVTKPGVAKAKGKMPNFLSMTDEQIEAIDPNAF